MKHNVYSGLIVFVLMLTTLIGVGRMSIAAPTAHAHRPAASVCYLTGLTGPALQENILYCSTNVLTGVTANCCTSTYLQAIHLAQQQRIVVGTPEYLTTTVDWAGTPVTWVWFTSGLVAWHYNPSGGVATIWDPVRKITLYSGR